MFFRKLRVFIDMKRETINQLEATLDAARQAQQRMVEEYYNFLSWTNLTGQEADDADAAIDAEYLDMVNEKFANASRENKSALNNLIYEN